MYHRFKMFHSNGNNIAIPRSYKHPLEKNRSVLNAMNVVDLKRRLRIPE